MIKYISNKKSKYIGFGILNNSKYGYYQVYRKMLLNFYFKVHQE